MPNICQTDETIAVLKANPKTHCGPTAAANALISLARNFQMLIEPIGRHDITSAINRLIEQLSGCMKTGSIDAKEKGTNAINLAEGTKKYVTDRGYKISRCEWKGWGAGEIYPVCESPSTNWIVENSPGNSNVILHLGWYELDPDDFKYYRSSGHYVNIAGFQDEENKLIVHDPSPRSKQKPKHCETIEIERGLLNNFPKLHDATSYLELNGIDVNRSLGANVAVIDGAFTFEVSCK